jgi:hypothetical protein
MLNFFKNKNLSQVKRHILIHAHIFKNAGTTFDYSLKNNFGKNFIDYRFDHHRKQANEFLLSYIKQHASVKAISCHQIYNQIRNSKDYTFHYVYLLRHPIERVKSVYLFEKNQPQHESLGAKMAKKFTFEQYVEWRMLTETPPTIRNLQTIFLASQGNTVNDITQLFSLAKKNIEKFPLIGMVDRYDDSMVVFEEYLKPFFSHIDLAYVKQNVNLSNQTLSINEAVNEIKFELKKELYDKLVSENQYDLELYYMAHKLLDKRISQIDSFAEKLDNLKHRNKRLENQRL